MVLWAALLNAKAQNVATFDDYPLQTDSVYYGADGAGGFSSGAVWFPNEYDPEYDFWSGFAVSIKTDAVTEGFDNQFSVVTGGGAEDSDGYAVVYLPWDINLELDSPVLVEGFYITNSVYAYLDMVNGSGFTKKFGGTDGTDPDFFKLIVTGIDDAGNETGKKEFYLADLRSDNPEEDYIVNDWVWLDLTSFGAVKELNFSMESSDTSDFGINTPTYFCMDNFTVSTGTSAPDPISNNETGFTIYPNPVSDVFYVDVPQNSEGVTVTDIAGKVLYRKPVTERGKLFVPVLAGMSSGIYFLQLHTPDGVETKKIIKY